MRWKAGCGDMARVDTRDLIGEKRGFFDRHWQRTKVREVGILRVVWSISSIPLNLIFLVAFWGVRDKAGT